MVRRNEVYRDLPTSRNNNVTVFFWFVKIDGTN